VETFQDLFEEALRDIYYAERAILKALPKMAKKSTSEELAAAFTSHHEQTGQQVVRLEQIFERLGKTARGKKCPAIDGILEESELLIEARDEAVRDAGLLAAAQAVEHYEIARYGTLKAWAEKLEMPDVAELLEKTLQEEKASDKKLTSLAETEINVDGRAGQR
jgi:ferritin-like metal-binding protein YciE